MVSDRERDVDRCVSIISENESLDLQIDDSCVFSIISMTDL